MRQRDVSHHNGNKMWNNSIHLSRKLSQPTHSSCLPRNQWKGILAKPKREEVDLLGLWAYMTNHRTHLFHHDSLSATQQQRILGKQVSCSRMSERSKIIQHPSTNEFEQNTDTSSLVLNNSSHGRAPESRVSLGKTGHWEPGLVLSCSSGSLEKMGVEMMRDTILARKVPSQRVSQQA